MKFGQLIECNQNFFFKNHAENEEERLVPEQFGFLEKSLGINFPPHFVCNFSKNNISLTTFHCLIAFSS